MSTKINSKKKEHEIFNRYKKNKNKLVLTGGSFNPWFWRDGEISFKMFGDLSIIEKETHINYLMSIGQKNRSTNDDYILKHHGPKRISENIHYFSIDDNDEIKNLIDNLTSTEDVTDTGATIPDEDVIVGELFSFDNENISTEHVTDTGAILVEDVIVGESSSLDNENKPTEDVTDTGATIPDESQLMSYGKEYLEEYLNLFFQYENKHWKDDLKFSRTVDQFIENTKNYMFVNDLTIAHIKAYKNYGKSTN